MQTIGGGGKLYEVSHLQLFQGDQIRGYGGASDPREGRRLLALPLHSSISYNPTDAAGPAGNVKIAADGSLAAFVPARRAMTWQLTGDANEGIVRERYWLTFQSGEIRVCASCHGVNSFDQAGQTSPQSKPEALRTLLRFWRNLPPAADPQFSMKVRSGAKGKSTLKPGASYAVSVEGVNSSAASRSVELRLSINNQVCPNPLVQGETDEEGVLTFSGKVPKAPANLKLSLSLVSNFAVVATSQANVKTKNGKRRLPTAQAKKLCKRFKLS